MPFAVLLLMLGAAPAYALQHKLDFESGLGGWSAIKDTSYFNWARWRGGTHSGHTGPASAHEGSYYLYLEASRNHPARTAYLQSPEFGADLESISFYYHMYGAHMGTLTLEGFDGSNWTTLWTTTGESHKRHKAPWTSKEINLAGRGLKRLRFQGTTIDNRKSSQYRGDMAIDYVLVITGEIPPGDNWRKTQSGAGIYYGIYYAPGNVGIGDTQPKADLSILGNLSKPLTGRVTVPANSTDVTGVGTQFTRELTVGDSLRIGDEVFIITEISGNTELAIDTAHTVGVLNATAYTDSNLLSVETGAETSALLVDRSGNVGIGVANPAARLDVAGGVRVGGEMICDAKREGTIRYNDAGDEIEFCDGSAWSRVEGPEGPKGEQGPAGAQGPRGLQGPKGNTGATGSQGPKGDKGDIGLQGLKGDKGDTGTTGPQGAKGNKGDTGPTGPQGPKGDQGPAGAQGLQGPKGDKGDPGLQGLKGDEGDKGDTGDAFWSQSGGDISYIGNVGIGTTSPTEKLDVNGDINARGSIGFKDVNGNSKAELFLKTGNNGSASCGVFCAGSQWGKVGACIASISMDDSYYNSYECNETAGHAVWCICVAPH